MNNSQLYKGSLTTVILKLLEENGRMYGYEMTQKVKEMTADEVTINEGALYPALHKLEAEGLAHGGGSSRRKPAAQVLHHYA